MSQVVLRLFSSWSLAGVQSCYNVASSAALDEGEISILKAIFGDGFSGKDISLQSEVPASVDVVEIGPRLSSATPYSTNAVSQCHEVGLTKIVRVECSQRYQLPFGADRAMFVETHHDRMTECEYLEPIVTFDAGGLPEPTYTIPLMEEGPNAFLKFENLNKLSVEERQFYYDYFVGQEKRNPTIVEMMDLYNANSEHCRHGYFKGRQVIDGVPMLMTLMDIVQGPYRSNPGKSLMAFSDNSSGVEGYQCLTIGPTHPGQPSPFAARWATYHLIATAETHNLPTGVSPFAGSATGVGGRDRDIQATGRGGIIGAGVAGYCVGQVSIPGYDLPWEKIFACPPNLASPLAILIGASNGASDYGNKFGEPLTSGFVRSFGMKLPSGERWEFLKPVMYTAGIGMVDGRHTMKSEAKKGMLIVQIGGPAYRIGFGGGSASSLMQGENEAHLDFNAVQRGDGEMKQKVNSVIRACIEMGKNNPIESIHDQGAAGPANVLKELVEKSGGKVELRRIVSGDPTMSVVELWICEYQERIGFLISPERIAEFQAICAREKVNCEVLGEVTGDGRFVVHDENDGSTPVNFKLAQVLGGMPQKTFRDDRIAPILLPFQLPETVTVGEALIRVLHDLAVCSKEFLVHKVDRSVGGLVARQQCCGSLQLPVADNAIQALSFFSSSGSVTSIGEQPIKMLISPAAGARMAVGEALTNMASALVSSPDDVWSSANWMWAAKLPGEGAAIWDAATAMAQFTREVGMAMPNRGKDSLSMATRVGGVEMVKSGRQLVIYAYAPMPDVTAHVTPDIKQPGRSTLIHIDMAFGKTRLGGSSLAHVYGQLGNESPDVDEPRALRRGFDAMQRLLSDKLLLSAHDISDGGLIVTLLEMAFAGNCGLEVNLSGPWSPIERLFAEELGWVVECGTDNVSLVMAICRYYGLSASVIGATSSDDQVSVTCNSDVVIDTSMTSLRGEWRSTSYQLERLQMNPVCAAKEKRMGFRRKGPKYHVSFEPSVPPIDLILGVGRHRVAILREEGSNGYREMIAAFYQAGFDPVDVHMTDLLEGRTTLDGFRGLVAVGGFSYADVPASAKGWASTIRFNPELKEMFAQFLARSDTFSLGVCNGAQLFGLLGIVPWAGISDEEQPRFVHNISRRFDSRWSTVKVFPSPSIMLAGMEGSVLGVWTAHGEGRLQCGSELLEQILSQGLAPVRYVDDASFEAENYPANPNGSPFGITALCTPDGRHLAMMPHPERVFQDRQWPWMPEDMKKASGLSPWLQMFINAWHWCEKTKTSGNK